jgi:hypothetical protein
MRPIDCQKRPLVSKETHRCASSAMRACKHLLYDKRDLLYDKRDLKYSSSLQTRSPLCARPPGKRDLLYDKRDLLYIYISQRLPCVHASANLCVCARACVCARMCICHMVGLFCHIVGLFCHIVGLFCPVCAVI